MAIGLIRHCAVLWLAVFQPLAAQATVPIETTEAQALDRLRKELVLQAKHQADPLPDILARYAVDGVRFTLRVRDEQEKPVQAWSRPSQVPDEDWQRFLRFWQPEIRDGFASENGTFHFTLIDLDENGERDLLVDYYIGGTGLFTQTEAFRYDPKRGFVPVAPRTDADSADYGYSINGRGGDQAIYLLRLEGRLCLVYRESRYGEDLLTVHRPLQRPAGSRASAKPALKLRYRYSHTPSPDRSGETRNDEAKTDPGLSSAAQTQLRELADARRHGHGLPDAETPCPAPASEGESQDVWPWRDAGHYTFEYAEDLRIVTRAGCYSASIVHFLSSYRRSYESCCALWVYAAPGEQIAEIPLVTQRRLVSAEIEPLRPDGE